MCGYVDELMNRDGVSQLVSCCATLRCPANAARVTAQCRSPVAAARLCKRRLALIHPTHTRSILRFGTLKNSTTKPDSTSHTLKMATTISHDLAWEVTSECTAKTKTPKRLVRRGG